MWHSFFSCVVCHWCLCYFYGWLCLCTSLFDIFYENIDSSITAIKHVIDGILDKLNDNSWSSLIFDVFQAILLTVFSITSVEQVQQIVVLFLVLIIILICFTNDPIPKYDNNNGIHAVLV